MTDFNPFGPASEDPTGVVEEEGGDSRKAVFALGGLVAVALAAGAFFFLGGSPEEEELFVPPARAAAPAAPAPEAEVATLPAATNLALGRNPFRALYIQPAAAPAEDTSGTDTGTD